jgi:hypothetical protein
MMRSASGETNVGGREANIYTKISIYFFPSTASLRHPSDSRMRTYYACIRAVNQHTVHRERGNNRGSIIQNRHVYATNAARRRHTTALQQQISCEQASRDAQFIARLQREFDAAQQQLAEAQQPRQARVRSSKRSDTCI